MSAGLSPNEVLARLPQQEPFRFVDEILEIDDEHVLAAYRWRPEADFYRGHFPGNPVTPGVLLVESMAQASVVALGIYLLEKELADEAGKLVTLFTDANVARVKALKRVADDLGVTRAQLALAWVLRQSGVARAVTATNASSGAHSENGRRTRRAST